MRFDRLAAALFFFCCATCECASAQSNTAADIVAKYRNSVLFISVTATQNGGRRLSWSGTGFFISQSGYIITACHMIPDPSQFSNIEYRASVGTSKITPTIELEAPVTCDPVLDVGLLKFPEGTGISIAPLPIGDDRNVQAGGKLVSLGFPLQSDLTPHEGLLGNKNGPHGRWQTDIKMNHGDSGGPVFDLAGNVIGVAVGGDVDQPTEQPLDQNYFVPINLIGAAINLQRLLGAPGPSVRPALAGGTGWIFAGYFVPNQDWTEDGPYVSHSGSPCPMTWIGSVVEITKKARPVVVLDYGKVGASPNPLRMPSDYERLITASDLTGAVVPVGTKVLIRDVDNRGAFSGRATACWLRIVYPNDPMAP